MKIMICGSMRYAPDMIRIKSDLEKIGHTVFLPHDTETHLSNSDFVDDLENNKKHAIKTDIMRECFKLIEKSDAILVLNFDRNNTKGYIGTSALMEIGVAHFLNKKIFLYNPLPSFHKHRWAHEVSIMQPITINSDLALIS